MSNDDVLRALGDQWRKSAESYRADACAAEREPDRSYRESTADCYETLASIAATALTHCAALQARADKLRTSPLESAPKLHMNGGPSRRPTGQREKVVGRILAPVLLARSESADDQLERASQLHSGVLAHPL
jgi:hypothetical protein